MLTGYEPDNLLSYLGMQVLVEGLALASFRVAVALVRESPERHAFEPKLFARIVPACSSIGLLDAGDGWLRRRFGELGVLQYEHQSDQTDLPRPRP